MKKIVAEVNKLVGKAKNGDLSAREQLVQLHQQIASELHLEDPRTSFDMGLALKEMGLLEDALAEFQKCKHSPDLEIRTEALVCSFFIYEEQQNWLQAVALLEQLAVDPRSKEDKPWVLEKLAALRLKL